MTADRYRLAAAGIVLLYLVFGAGFLLTRPPQADEGTFGNAAYLLMTRGYLGMPTVESAGYPWLQGLDRYMYWNMPLFMITLAGWFQVFGVSLIGQRVLSLLVGLAGVLAWHYTVGKLSGNRRAALLALALIALNYDVLNVASAGRIDMMAASLWALGVAAYLGLREASLLRAMAVAHTCLAASAMTHPYAAFGIFAVLSLMVWRDRSRLRLAHLAVAALPYLVAGGAWMLYAAQQPELAKGQLLGNVAAGRMNGFRAPLETLWREVSERYITLFAGWRPGVPLAMRAKVLLLVAYFGSFAAALLIPGLRKKPGAGFLLFLMGSFFLLLTYFENLKWYVYLIHLIPVYCCVLALVLDWFWGASRAAGVLARVALAGLLLFHLASVGYRIRLNSYGRAFLPAAEFLRAAARPGECIMASSEFAHPMGFDGRVIDDYRLGYKSGKKPVFVVVEKQFQEWFDIFQGNPELAAHIRRELEEGKKLLFEVRQGPDFYRIYGPPDRAGAR